MTDINRFSMWFDEIKTAYGETTLEVKPNHLRQLCLALRDETDFAFDQLIDVCGVDYLQYGLDDWETQSTTETGFSRGVTPMDLRENPPQKARFAVVYHLLSLKHNQRLRLRVSLSGETKLVVDSVMDIWPSADWYERETFDLYGIIFKGHPDLRRLLTDYGFIGHPFRKDFPLIGHVEARYDASLGRVIYDPISIKPRILEPKVIRHDHRYLESNKEPRDGN